MIDSPANPTIKALRALQTGKGRRERGQFLVEGVRAVEDGLRAGVWPVLCLYNFELLSRTERGQKLVKSLQAPAPHTKPQMLEATPRALEAATDTVHSQGIIAAFNIPEWPRPSHPQTPALALICDDIADPGNLGTLLRTAEAAGAHAVWLTPRCVDLYSPKVVRAGMGAHFRLPLYPEQDWGAIAEGLSSIGVSESRIFATEADAPTPYYGVDWREPSALIVSSEAHGLSAEGRLHAGGGSLRIPMSGDTESLNAAISAAVILFEAARQRSG